MSNDNILFKMLSVDCWYYKTGIMACKKITNNPNFILDRPQLTLTLEKWSAQQKQPISAVHPKILLK